MYGEITRATGLAQVLRTHRVAQVGELAVVFTVALAVMAAAAPLAGKNPLARQAVVMVANALMFVMIWLGLRLRGQEFRHFGLSFRLASWRTLLRTVLLSLVVFVAAVAAFIMGAIVMANIVGMPKGADMGGYNYLRGNLPMLALALLAVYVNASFGEEVIYRAFLINRLAELGSGGKVAWRLAVVISSIVFGLIHFHWGVAGMVQTACMGLALGVSYVTLRRNLWVTILAHGYMDTILMVQMYLGAG